MSMPMSRLGVGALAVATVAAVSPAAAANESEQAEEHCVLTVVDEGADGELITGTPDCFATFEEAMEAAGLPYSDPSELPDNGLGAESAAAAFAELAEPEFAALSSSGTLGVHFDGANRTGSSITVTGTTCGGGYVNLSSSWVNRVSSTWNFCATTGFWDGFDKTGDSQLLGSTDINLSTMNNRANSIGYAS